MKDPKAQALWSGVKSGLITMLLTLGMMLPLAMTIHRGTIDYQNAMKGVLMLSVPAGWLSGMLDRGGKETGAGKRIPAAALTNLALHLLLSLALPLGRIAIPYSVLITFLGSAGYGAALFSKINKKATNRRKAAWRYNR